MVWSRFKQFKQLGSNLNLFFLSLSFTLNSEAYNRRPGGRRHSKGNPESSLPWKPQEQAVTEMITEEGGKGLRRPHCTVEEVSPFNLILFENYFMNLGGNK